MVLSYYLIKPFYSCWWRLLNLFSQRSEIVFYCHTPIDLELWNPVQKHLQPIRIVSDKPQTIAALKDKGIACRSLPVFPKAVIMCRVAAHKFPSRKVIKIGMTHGAYHFKRFTKSSHYAPFSLYLFTSQQDLQNASANGITCGKVGGYPKLDEYLPRPISTKKPDSDKPSIMFTATYDSSGMSAIDRWISELPLLAQKYQIVVSLHPWMSKHYKNQLLNMPGIHYLNGENPLPYIEKADVCIVDTSSIIAECCAMDKPLISWILAPSPRTVTEIIQILEKASIRISESSELAAAIAKALENPDLHAKERQQANQIFFDALDGKAGFRAATHIINILPELKK